MRHEMPIEMARWFKQRGLTLPFWFSRFVCDDCGIDRVWMGDTKEMVDSIAEATREAHEWMTHHAR